MDACIGGECKVSEEPLFQPNTAELKGLGLACDSLITAQEDGTVLIPFQNLRQELIIVG